MISSTYNISSTTQAVLEVLAYYHIFHHPLKKEEIYSRVNTDRMLTNSIDETLYGLVSMGAIEENSGYYFLKNSSSIIQKREEGEIRAKSLLKVAKRMSKIIYWFPFVRGVFVSGSLSKGSVPVDADIDYFVITKQNKLWITRTMLVMFKRLFLLGSKKYFCVNYFVDESNLEIPDKNIFTATEVSTVIPLQGRDYCEKFMTTNKWYKDFYPHMPPPKSKATNPDFIKKVSQTVIELLFFHRLAERLDKSFMKKTYSRWTNMYGSRYSDEEFELAFRSKRGTSKNHDKNYQKRVLETVEKNITFALSQIKTKIIDG
ncbi:MAG: hypothetical protein ACJAVN_000567 [Roseivirga sp.]|jgi:hypothetical protein